MDQKPPRTATTGKRPPHPATMVQRKAAPHPAIGGPRALAPHPATVAQRKLAPHPATAAQRKVAAHAATIVQRAQAPEPELAEGQNGEVAAGKKLKFTALAAGCMAVAADLDNGGGVGVHMAMQMDNGQQWAGFLQTLNNRKVKSITLYGDMVGNKQGWYYKFAYDAAMFMLGDPETNQSPRSLSSLQAAQINAADETNGWAYDLGSARQWFAAKFGIKTKDVTTKATNKAVEHQC